MIRADRSKERHHFLATEVSNGDDKMITVLFGSMLSAGSAAAETSGGQPADPPRPGVFVMLTL